MVATYRNVYVAADHPLNPAGRAGKYVSEHRLLLWQAIGPGPHACHWCESEIDWMPGRATARGALVADHLDGNPANNAATNLVPSCHGCNAGRSRAIRDDELFVLKLCQGVMRKFRADQR